MRPLIGVTAWRRELDTFLGPELLQTLSTYYSDAVIDAGMTPVMFPNGQDPQEADRLVAMVDGLLVSGGDDLDPSTYGAQNDGSKGFSREVDDFEIALVMAAQRQGKPLLAICRGLQTLNVALGGTLRQEVLAAGTTHEVINEETDPVELNERRHVVTFEDGSWLGEMYQATEAKVNTLHHQGIAELAAGLIVEATTDDGLVEAARCSGQWWALGVQWHPERMDSSHHQMFRAFREAAAAPSA